MPTAILVTIVDDDDRDKGYQAYSIEKAERRLILFRMDRPELIAYLEGIDRALRDQATLYIYESATCILLGEPDRTSLDVDVAGPYSVVATCFPRGLWPSRMSKPPPRGFRLRLLSIRLCGRTCAI